MAAVVQTKSVIVTGTATPSITLNSAPTAGNVLTVFHHQNSTQASQTCGPGAWTNGTAQTGGTGGSTQSCRTHTKVSDGSEQTITITLSSSTDCFIEVIEWSGVDGTTPQIGEGSSRNASGTYTLAVGVTPTASKVGTVVNFIGLRSSSTSMSQSGETVTGTNAGAVTEDIDVPSNGSQLSCGAAWHAPVSSTSGTYNGATTPSVAAVNCRAMVVLQDSTGGVSRTVATAIAGLGAVTATLSVQRFIAVSPAGAGIVSPGLRVTRTIAATPAGVGSVSPGLRVTRRISGAVAGVGSVSVTRLDITRRLATAVSGIGSIVVTRLDVTRRLSSVAAGQGVVSPNLRVQRFLATGIAGTSAVVSALRGTRTLSVGVAGQGTVVSDFTIAAFTIKALATSIAGSSVVSPALQAMRRVVVAVTGTSAVTSDLKGTRTMSTTVVGTGVVTPNLKIAVKGLATAVIGQSGVTAAINLSEALRTNIVGNSSVHGLLSIVGQVVVDPFNALLARRGRLRRTSGGVQAVTRKRRGW